MYKPHREMTAQEKGRAKWDSKGQPRLIWDSGKWGTYRRANLHHQEMIESTIESLRAPILDWSHLQPHRRHL